MAIPPVAATKPHHMEQPEIHIAKFIVYTDSALVASTVAVRAEKAYKKGKTHGYCIVRKRRVYWKLRTKPYKPTKRKKR